MEKIPEWLDYTHALGIFVGDSNFWLEKMSSREKLRTMRLYSLYKNKKWKYADKLDDFLWEIRLRIDP